ncbi:MAG TPA: hypothetical protein VFU46_05540 [Gemmatimonadales bacterium]|nr:hypothetical protein [Gemmatimonadales bacterium]
MRALTLAVLAAALGVVAGCKQTGDREFEVQKPVIGVESDTVRTPDVDVGMKKDTIGLPDVDVDVKTKKTEVRVPDVDVQGADEPDTN